MGMNLETNLKIVFADKLSCQSASAALVHELELDKKRSRANASISIDGKTMIIRINASDVVALRASINAFLRSLQVFEDLGRNINPDSDNKQ